MMPTTVRVVASTELEDLLPALVELLRESVNGGASLGFLPPLPHHEARRYWRSLGQELRGGSRLLFAAHVADRLAGTGQLALPSWPTARHRAELNKVMVAMALVGTASAGASCKPSTTVPGSGAARCSCSTPAAATPPRPSTDSSAIERPV